MEGHRSFRRNLRRCLPQEASDQRMKYIWMAAGLFCLVYYGVIALYAGPDADFGWFWVALGAVFMLLYGRDCLFAAHPAYFPEALHRGVVSVLCAGLAVIALFCIPVLRGMHISEPADLEYVIVLGAQVKKTVPSRALTRRLERAYTYAADHPDTILVLSGGKGRGEEISEAECMRRYLSGRGLEDKRLILEDRSTTTRENLIYSDRLTGCSGVRCGILSNDFHVARALKIAGGLGYKEAFGIDARGDAVMELHYIVRESAALIVEEVRGWLD